MDRAVIIERQRDKGLCADGYDVTNLVSSDPALRRRGFKLEYFLRPPVQVELCRVDVELWPWGMDRGQACKRLEISTSSDRPPSQNFHQAGRKLTQPKEQVQMQVKDQNEQNREKRQKHGRAVTQLRVTLPFGGAASALGLKALVVWGQPARCCPPEEVETIKRVHEASKRQMPRPVLFASSISQPKPPPQAATPPSNISIPEEFLDPITQEIMMLPMLLPSGVSVDNTTLEEHQKTEATWGRPPNDPFTGVPFTSSSQPLPNPQLKSRIDRFLLQKGMIRRDGMLGRQGEGENPQASRLISTKCMSCGPRDRGRCFGPSICCGEGLGCLIGSPESAHCVEENYMLTPCQAGGRPCGSEGGHCAVSGLCCNSESCAVDSDCLGEAEASDPADSSAVNSPAELLLRLLHVASRGQTEY
ncbi:Vasotocin-neurophysin VT 1 [Nibea albiflora]|uniref:Vasotocin-neurophysin VT 1 n=1 Tax=Nibea albiflora TaxID=240163 RepID=A0ACB7FBB6_NIBAL|nr:Vasotocin-neurophysin VT 1 [Nibea albiflora]